MPIIDMSVDVLLHYINQHGDKKIKADDLHGLMTHIGVEVDGFADTKQFVCGICGKISDRTEAQGPPLSCAQCGTDFRQRPDALTDKGANRVIRLDMLAVRPDIFDPGGMARYVRGYLGAQTGLTEYPAADAKITVKVDPNLSNDQSYRPFIACAVLRNVALDHERIKMLMNLQEDLHWALGRDRKLASIGAYDLDTLSGEVFHYDAVAPDELKFVPLGFEPDSPTSMLTPREILEKHGTGQAYAHLLKSHTAYPLLRDGAGNVLSMPPIINSEATRVTMNSRNLFIDVTGLSRRTVDRALNIMVTNLKELIPEIEIECVNIDDANGRRITPDLAPSETRLDVREAAETIGLSIDAAGLTELLERMGHRVQPDGDALRVFSPAYRNDIMHAVDLIEDAAIAYGYDNLVPELVPTFTVGSPLPIEEQSAVARRVMAGLGFHQVMTLALTCPESAFNKWRLPPDDRAVLLANPISSEQTMCRVSLLPGSLETLAINKQYDLPQHLFEVGDCSFFDPKAETGAREERFVGVTMIGTHVGYADIRAVADAFIHELGAACKVEPTEHNSFIPGRAAALVDGDGLRIGVMGELHPEVLENYGLKHPVSVMELSLEKLLK